MVSNSDRIVARDRDRVAGASGSATDARFAGRANDAPLFGTNDDDGEKRGREAMQADVSWSSASKRGNDGL